MTRDQRLVVNYSAYRFTISLSDIFSFQYQVDCIPEYNSDVGVEICI
jgi:hypothetical protein